MKLQTQYGKDAAWADLPASDVPMIADMWVKSVACATSQTSQAVLETLGRGEVIELVGKGIEWHDRIRRTLA
ncbi:MAG: hypothetical protein ACRD5R_05130 [Candidatus Acidiferrales bacterium]